MTPGSPQPQQWIPRPHVEAPPALSFSISWRSIAISLALSEAAAAANALACVVLGDLLHGAPGRVAYATSTDARTPRTDPGNMLLLSRYGTIWI